MLRARFLAPLLILCLASYAHGAVTYSAVDDFSNSINTDAATWSYRYSDDVVRDGVYSLFTHNSDPTPLWNPSTPFWHTGNGNVPLVGVNRSGSPISIVNSYPQFDWPDDTILMHPGSAGLTVVSWLSPLDAIVNVQFSFADLDSNGGDGIAWYVDLGPSGGELDSGLFGNGGSSGVKNLTNVKVYQGERINFIVSPNDNHNNDSTEFLATITVVPEPSTLTLFAILGVTGSVILWRRRRILP